MTDGPGSRCETGKVDKQLGAYEVVEKALANALDNFELAMKPRAEGLMIYRMDMNQEIVTRYLNDQAFQTAAFKALIKNAEREEQKRKCGKEKNLHINRRGAMPATCRTRRAAAPILRAPWKELPAPLRTGQAARWQARWGTISW